MKDKLLARIEKLERQNKRMRIALSGFCLCLGALFTMGLILPQKPEKILDRLEVREIVLKNGVMSATLTPQSLTFSAKSGYEAEKPLSRHRGYPLVAGMPQKSSRQD